MTRKGVIPSKMPMPYHVPTMPGMEAIALVIMVPTSLLYDERISIADFMAEYAALATEGLKGAVMDRRCEAHGHLHPEVEACKAGKSWDGPDDHDHGGAPDRP